MKNEKEIRNKLEELWKELRECHNENFEKTIMTKINMLNWVLGK